LRNRLQYTYGFTLIELMMAVIIVSISIVALYYMYVQGKVLLEEQFHRRLALEKAQNRMELLKYLERTNDDNPGHVPFSARERGVEFLVRPDTAEGTVGIVAQYEVDVESSPGGQSLYETVTVTYTWEEPSGREFEVKLVSRY
jgi:prepilin-type N-terminal cleavage/methylation domain-containing protein